MPETGAPRRRRRGDIEQEREDERRVFLGWRDGSPRWHPQKLYECGFCGSREWLPPVERGGAPGWVVSRSMWNYGYGYCPEHSEVGRAVDERMTNQILDLFHEQVGLEQIRRLRSAVGA